ncbi:MAG TPA: MFS transporter [Bryobacteraceae bacterium]|nr:MFS transporter [Bryobacteraceae bacterium]HOQ43685.1 MFS transporter [Bryobacteraceae bacterium]HPQ14091.1 MFS transporter [Bryobacteraceae bacterium]HPU72453.1 MFS transporter [Bryobacteraceae bacterium]
MGNWAFAFRALRARNYRLFFIGQSVSLIGVWMMRVATSWLVYRLTGSSILLGVVGFAGQIPTFLLGPVAGVLVDRWDRHRTLVVTQVFLMLQSLAMAGLTLAGVITPAQIILLSVVQGVINSVDMPARQAFVVQMVENREDLGNAIALNSSMFNGARLAGPAIAGMVIAAVGEGVCFLLDGLSYVAVIGSLLAMKIQAAPPRSQRDLLVEIREGWRYVSGSLAIRSLLVMVAVISLFGMPYTVLMPVFAANVLGGGPNTLGFLMAATGMGALGGGILLAMRRSVLGLGKQIVFAILTFGGSLIVFGLSSNLWLSLFVLAVSGYGMIQQMAGTNTILQTIVDEEKRGRVMSFYTMAFMGAAPFGSLLAGALSDRIGAPWTVVVCGLVCLAGGGWLARKLPAIRREIRPIYIQLGILPEVAAGVQQASTLQTPPQN